MSAQLPSPLNPELVVRECPVLDRCGGCPEMQRTVLEERRFKRDALWRGWHRNNLGGEVVLDWHTCPAVHRYRNRLRLRVSDEGQVVFFNEEKGTNCLVVHDSVLEGLRCLQQLGALPLGDGGRTHLEVRARDAEGRWGLYVAGTDSNQWRAAEPWLRERLGPQWLVGFEGGSSIPCQRIGLPGGVDMFVPVNAFVQINSDVNEQLVRYVAALSQHIGARSFVDLFMGCGNLSLPLLARGLSGRGVELHRGAAAAAQRSAQRMGTAYDLVVGGCAHAAVGQWVIEQVAADLVVCDPPRAGLKQLASGVADLVNEHLVLCSCSPNSLWRDIGLFRSLGFVVSRLAAFEMFPRTSHLEVVAWLRRA